MKKSIKIILIAVAIILVLAIVITFSIIGYMFDRNDTEALFRENVAKVGYENSIETALPQTEIYNFIKAHFSSALPDGKVKKKAIIIGYDGCRADILNVRQNENSAISAMLDDGASINLAYCGGVNYPAKNTQDTSTAPGWCSILTGEWATVHGITGNSITKSLETKTLLTSLTEKNIIDRATFITSWDGHFTVKKSTYGLEKNYCEENGLNVAYNKCKNDKASLKATINELEKTDCADFTFVIYEPTDHTGHGRGFSYNNPQYKKAFKTADSYGYETLKTIKNRATYASEDWLIIITADHGGIGGNHGGDSIQERMTFIVTNHNLN